MVMASSKIIVGRDATPLFSVLLGPDYAGKSSVISDLSSRGWRCVSYDDALVPEECSLINDLRDEFITRALRGLGDQYSSDFIVTLLQASVVYLRDQILKAAADQPVIVDSYYYKILAKGMLTGLVNEEMFAWWRSFPRPRQVIYLDVDSEIAWRRSGNGAQLNRFEYYWDRHDGGRPRPEDFHRFQTDLRSLMLAEVGTVPLTVLSGRHGVEQLADTVERIARSGDGTRVGG